MDTNEARRWLKKLGVTFTTHKGGSGHQTAELNGKTTQLPMHGKGKELGKGLIAKIKRDLNIK